MGRKNIVGPSIFVTFFAMKKVKKDNLKY